MIDGVCVRVGDVGVAESQLRPAGRIRIGHNYVDVVSDGTFVEPEEKVEVINVRGNRIVVRRVG
jgi:membrane-bound serine protease (ClpP class)